jgi:hypothetical protein
MTETIAGVTIPDTVVVKAATELALDADGDVLAHFDPDFRHEDFVNIITQSAWSE